MASIWMLSKDTVRGMDIIDAISDFLDEYQTKGCPSSEARDRVIGVMGSIILGARRHIESNVRADSFSMMVAEAAYTDMLKTPSAFASILTECTERIRLQSDYPDDCLDILRVIAKNATRVTSRRVDTKSLILH